jgi:hypothetical protein
MRADGALDFHEDGLAPNVTFVDFDLASIFHDVFVGDGTRSEGGALSADLVSVGAVVRGVVVAIVGSHDVVGGVASDAKKEKEWRPWCCSSFAFAQTPIL